ncbi:Down syndrome cell adhesion molecule-like protein Dscam2, partial [Dinothrombium tinctorium]
MSLPLNSRQFVDGKSGTLTIKRLHKEDSGDYKCVASNAKNESASGVTQINVVSPPAIDGHFFPKSIEVEEGTRARLICSINKGDPNFKITWFKNDKPLGVSLVSLSSSSSSLLSSYKHLPKSSENKHRFTIQHQEDSSTILFRNVLLSDGGKYTCLASNQFGSDNKTTRLVVNSPPKWIHEPANNVSGILNERMTIHCSADGYPPPLLIWQKGDGSGIRRNEFRSIKSNGIHIMSNGSLLFEALKDEDEAFYLCSATNGIGVGLSKTIFLNVNKPPKLDSKYQKIAVKVNESALLECRAKGDFPIVFIWLKDGHKVSLTQSNKKFTLKEEMDNEKSEAISLLTIMSVERADNALFSCEARNEFGHTSLNISLTVLETPSKPTNVSVIDIGSRTIRLSWSLKFDGNSPVRRYHVFFAEIKNGILGQLKRQLVNIENNALLLGNLRPVTQYSASVAAENEIGIGDISDPLNVTTSEEAPGGPPIDVRVQSTGSQSLKVSWSPPEADVQYGTILGYHIGYRISSDSDNSRNKNDDESSDQYQYKHFVQSNQELEEPFHTIYLTNLKRLTKYSIVIRAYNAAGSGPLSEPIEATTLETSPPISPIVRVLETTNSSIKLGWNRDEKDRSILTQYTLYWKEETKKGDFTAVKLAANVHEYTLTNLLCGTLYKFYMTATNSLGTGEPSFEVLHRTKGAAPVSPVHKAAFVNVNNITNEVTLNLGAWSNGGCPIHYFNVHKKLKYAKQWILVNEKVTVSGNNNNNRKYFTIGSHHFIPGKDYSIQVSARNDAGTTQAEYEIHIPKYNLVSLTTKMPAIALNNNLMAFDNYPLYRNLAYILPVVISFTVILFLILIIFMCLRKQSEPVYSNYSVSEEAKPTNSVSMSELSSQKSASRMNVSSKCDMNASSGGGNLRSNSIHSQLSNCTTATSGAVNRGEQQISPQKHHYTVHEYTEPYASDARLCHQFGKDHFATIKRSNPRTRSSMYISGYDVSPIETTALYTNKLP